MKKHEFPFKLSLSKVVWRSKNFLSVMQAFIKKKHIKVITYHLHSLWVVKFPTQFLHIKITFWFLRSYTYTFNRVIKVSKFKNEFMKSSFLPKYEPKIVRISAL